MDQRERFEATIQSVTRFACDFREGAFTDYADLETDRLWKAWQAAEADALERAAQVCDENAESVAHLERSNAATALKVTAMDIRKLAAPVERGGE